MKHNTYKPVQQVRDTQPIRTTCFHPSGETYVVGTNSKALKICKYPSAQRIRELIGEDGNMDGPISEPEISFTCLHIHCASVYCSSFNQYGDLLATGSNDQIVHIIKYDQERHVPGGNEYKLTIHTGTVRDVCFLQKYHNDGEFSASPSSFSMLLSAGGGEFEINLTDCGAMKTVQCFRGHEATVMSLHSCPDSDNMFISGSLDGTVKIWDTRCREPVSCVRNLNKSLHSIAPDGDCGQNISHGGSNSNANNNGQDQENRQPGREQSSLGRQQWPTTTTTPRGRQQVVTVPSNQGGSGGVPVGVVRVDPTGRLLVSGHQDGSCMLYDIRADRIIQTFQLHENQIRTVSFSPKSYYLLSGSYDRKVRLTDLQGNLTKPLPSVEVVEQNDKIVQTAWHPVDYNFVTTCADGSATLWTGGAEDIHTQ